MTDPIFLHSGYDRYERLGASQKPHRLAFALPLLPVCLSIFLLSGLVYHHVQNGGVAETTNLWQALQTGVYRVLGFVPAAMLSLLILAWSSIWFFTGKLERPVARLVRLFALTISLAILVNLEAASLMTGAYDGLVGGLLAPGLVRVFTPAGATLLVSLASVGALLLATDFFFFRYFDSLATTTPAPGAVAPAPAQPTEEADSTPEPVTGELARDLDFPEQDGSGSEEREESPSHSANAPVVEIGDQPWRSRRRVRLEELAPDVVEDEPLASRAHLDLLAAEALGAVAAKEPMQSLPGDEPESLPGQDIDEFLPTDVAEPVLGGQPVAPDADDDRPLHVPVPETGEVDQEIAEEERVLLPDPEGEDLPEPAVLGESETEPPGAHGEFLPDGDPLEAGLPADEVSLETELPADGDPLEAGLPAEDGPLETGTEASSTTASATDGNEVEDQVASVPAAPASLETAGAVGGSDEQLVEIPRPTSRQGLLFGALEPDLVADAVALVQDTGRANAAFLQRRLRVDYDTAVRLLDALRLAKVIDGALGDTHGRLLSPP